MVAIATVLSHDARKNMKRIGIKGSHLVFFFNFGGRNSPKMIYKTHYFIFPFNLIMRGGGKNFLSLLKIQNTNWKSKGNEGSLSPPQSALPSLHISQEAGPPPHHEVDPGAVLRVRAG